MFELRRDPVTGWWSAIVTDRAFEHADFAVDAAPIEGTHCRHCDESPEGDDEAVRRVMLRDRAFEIVPPGRDWTAQVELLPEEQPDTRGSWEIVVGPRDHHETFAAATPHLAERLLRHVRDAMRDLGEGAAPPDAPLYLQALQNHGRQAGSRTSHLNFELYAIPQVPHLVAEEIGGARSKKEPDALGRVAAEDVVVDLAPTIVAAKAARIADLRLTASTRTASRVPTLRCRSLKMITTMHSCLYFGRVRPRRFAPRAHAFSYGLHMVPQRLDAPMGVFGYRIDCQRVAGTMRNPSSDNARHRLPSIECRIRIPPSSRTSTTRMPSSRRASINPLVRVSPFTRGGRVSHRTVTHESILKLISYKFRLGFLTKRHRYAFNIGRTFKWGKPNLRDPGLPEPETIAATPCSLQGGAGAALRPKEHDLTSLETSGYLDSLGYEVKPPTYDAIFRSPDGVRRAFESSNP